jgi:hypothetical protein
MRYIPENSKEFEMSGIKRWHELGYTGKGIKIANMEGTDPTLHFFNGKIKDPFDNATGIGKNYHGHQTADILHQVAPDADIYILSNSGRYGSKTAEGDFVDVSIPFMEEEGIHLVNASLGGVDNPALNNRIKQAKEHGVTFVTSAGNSDESGVGGYARSGAWIVVGAVHLSAKGDILHAGYSSLGEEVDFAQFSGLYVHDARKEYKSRVFPVYGTSFSSPMLCGILALVQQFFLKKTGRTLYQNELYEFMKDYSIDLWEPGRDIKSGYGLFMLPNDPNTIDIQKYLGGDVMIDNPKHKIYEAIIPSQVIPPGHFVIPFRGLFEAENAEQIDWGWDDNGKVFAEAILPPAKKRKIYVLEGSKDIVVETLE